MLGLGPQGRAGGSQEVTGWVLAWGRERRVRAREGGRGESGETALSPRVPTPLEGEGSLTVPGRGERSQGPGAPSSPGRWLR